MIRFRFIAPALITLSLSAAIMRLAIREPVQAQHESRGASPTTERRARLAGDGTRAADDRRLEEVERQIAQLQLQLETERQRFALELQEQRDRVAQLTRAPQEHSAPEPSAEELERSDRDREQRRVAQLESLFDSESSDRAWSQAAAQQLASAVEQIAYDSQDRGASLVDAQCRASLCRLEVAASSLDSLNGFSQAFPSELGWQASMNQTIVHEDDGSLTSILYVSRDGRDLPAEVEALPGT